MSLRLNGECLGKSPQSPRSMLEFYNSVHGTTISTTALKWGREIFSTHESNVERWMYPPSGRPRSISLFLILSTCRMSDHGDSHVSVNHLSVCYPDLLSHRCSSQLCGSIGHLIVFKQNHYKGRDQTKSMQDQEDSALVKWVVIVPGKIEIIVARIKCLICLAVFKLH